MDFTPYPHTPIPCVGVEISDHLAMVNSLFIPSTHIWNSTLMRELFVEDDADWILHNSSPSGNIDDKLIWTPEPKGVFSIQSSYQFLHYPVSPSSPPLDAEDWRKLWKVPMQDRHKLLLWKVTWNALPCKINTCWSDNPTDEQLSCTLCHSAPESLAHLFFGCPLACMVWMESPWSLKIHELPSRSNGEWIHLLFNAGSVLSLPLMDFQEFLLYSAILLDSIWFSRNRSVHHGIQLEPSHVINKVRMLFLEHSRVWNATLQPAPRPSWCPSPINVWKINFDVPVP